MTIQQWPVSTKAAVQIDAMEQMVGATLDDVRNIDNMVRNTVLATLSFDHICNWTLILPADISTANRATFIDNGCRRMSITALIYRGPTFLTR